VTLPTPVSRFGITSLYRLLARWSLLQLGGAYTVAFTVAIILRGVALRRDWVTAYHLIAPLIAVLAFSFLFTVVTWYRDEDTVTAAVLLIIMTTVAVILGTGIHDFVFTGSIGTLIFAVAEGFLTTVVRVIIFFPVVLVLVWGGRRLRRFFAPATLNDENLP
jgi:hypothetical protein